MSNTNTRALFYRFLLFIDDLRDDWLTILDSYNVMCGLSPLHTDGDKPHYHGVIQFDTIKYQNTVQDLIDALYVEHAPEIQVCLSPRGSCRYFCHLDNPEKKLYDINDITTFSGFDAIGYISQNPNTDSGIFSDCIDIILENNIFSAAAIVLYARNNDDLLFRWLSKRSNFGLVSDFIKSYTYSMARMPEQLSHFTNYSLATN